jgi:alkane 1-monooxygenase
MFPLLATAGLALGGVWCLAVPLALFVFVPLLDLVGGTVRGRVEPSSCVRWLQYLPAAAVVYQVALVVWGAYVVSRPDTQWGTAAALTLSVGLVSGAVGITSSHELLHRARRFERSVSCLGLAFVVYLHFYFEHGHHHAWAATPKDAAFVGRVSVYRFLARTIPQQFLRCVRAETARLGRHRRPAWSPANQMWGVVLVPFAITGAFGALWGAAAVVFFLMQAFIAILLLETVNYIQHYGLERRRLPNGRYEPPSVVHAWDTDRRLSNFFAFSLERHAHHHAHPKRSFVDLTTEASAPQLPACYSAMIMLALVPPLWRQVMDPRVPRLREVA